MDLYDIRNKLSKGKSIYDLNLKVTYYARVSTDKDEQLHSIKNQINYYQDFIKSNTNWTYVNGYVDEGISGTSTKNRDSFMMMIDDARLGKFDFIVTKEISRFSRNTLDSIKYTQQLLSYGVGVLFQSDNINTLMPDAELRLTIMSSIAQDEVRKISERVKFGFRRAIESGVVLGSNRIWGYRKDEGKLVVVEEEAEMIKKIFDMYANQRMGMRRICNELTNEGYKNFSGNDLSFSTIKGIITNPKYKGYYCGNKTHKYDYKLSDVKILDQTEWIMYKDESGEVVPAIVSEEIWDKAQTILSKRSAKHSSEDISCYSAKYSYSCKVICGEHNVPYYRTLYRYKSGNKEAWQCKIYSEKGKQGCDSPIIYTTELDKVVKISLDEMITNKADIIHRLVQIYSDAGKQGQIQNDIAKLQAEVNNILKLKDKLLDLSLKGRLSDTEFEVRNNRFNMEVDDIKSKIEHLQGQQSKNQEIMKSTENLRKLISNELDFADGVSQGVIDSLLDRIVVYKTDNPSVISLKVYFKALKNEEIPFTLTRKRKNETSVCYTPYI